MIIKMNQRQYAELMGVKQPAISYRIKNEIHLPGVRKVERYSRFFLLHYDTDLNIHNSKKSFK